jgi:hypothetical protein
LILPGFQDVDFQPSLLINPKFRNGQAGVGINLGFGGDIDFNGQIRGGIDLEIQPTLAPHPLMVFDIKALIGFKPTVGFRAFEGC